MAVTATLTVRNRSGVAKRLDRECDFAWIVVEMALTGTYVADGFSADLGSYFRNESGIGDVLMVIPSIDIASANAAGWRIGYDYDNDKFLLYDSNSPDSQIPAGTELGTTGRSFTKVRILAIGYNG